MKNLRYLLVLCFMCALTAHGQQPPACPPLFARMMDAVAATSTCSFVLNLHERIDTKYFDSEFVVRLQAAPLRMYAYSVHPNPGAEALFSRGTNKDRVLINPNRFPFINLNLYPSSSLLRKNHQFEITQMGFGYMHDLMQAYIRREGNRFYALWSAKPDTTYKGKTYRVLEMNNPGYRITSYHAVDGENVTAIAGKLLVNDHKILELNPGLSDYDDVKAGQTLRVPDSFARKLVFFIDPETGLPFVQEVYDESGLYCRIEFSSVVVNPKLNDIDFSRDNPKYDF